MSKRARKDDETRITRRASYDLPEGMKERIAKIAEEHGTTASQIASFFLAEMIKQYEAGKIDLEPYKEPSPSLRYDHNLRVEFSTEY